MGKIYIICFLIFAVLQIVKTQENEAKDCLDKINLTRSWLEGFVGDDTKVLPVDDPQFNKFADCFYVKRGYMDKDGKISFGNFALTFLSKYHIEDEAVKRDIVKQVVDFCKNDLEGKSAGHQGVRAYNCVNKKVQELAQHQKV